MGIHERKKREQLQKKEAILEAAHELFAEHGIEGTSMTRIAERAELSKGALYLYFHKKESIVYELLFDFLIRLKELIREASQSEESGYERSRRILESFLAFYHTHNDYLILSRYIDYQVSSISEAGEDALRCFEIIDEMKRIAVRVIREGQADGSIRRELDPELTSATVVHVVESFLLKISTREKYFTERSNYEPRELVDHLLELILYSLKY